MLGESSPSGYNQEDKETNSERVSVDVYTSVDTSGQVDERRCQWLHVPDTRRFIVLPVAGHFQDCDPVPCPGGVTPSPTQT